MYQSQASTPQIELPEAKVLFGTAAIGMMLCYSQWDETPSNSGMNSMLLLAATIVTALYYNSVNQLLREPKQATSQINLTDAHIPRHNVAKFFMPTIAPEPETQTPSHSYNLRPRH